MVCDLGRFGRRDGPEMVNPFMLAAGQCGIFYLPLHIIHPNV